MNADPVRGFGPAADGERIVFGAPRPGFGPRRAPDGMVDAWLAFMSAHGIRRVVCLLSDDQLAAYTDLLSRYRAHFGAQRVRHAPIPEFSLADRATLVTVILPFLAAADQQGEPVVVHCSAGIGRTGHVLAAWLVAGRGYTNADAIAAVARGGRDARESGDRRLDTLLDAVRDWAATR